MIVFLDIDGVLNQLQPNYYIDKSCVENLGLLCRYLNARVVLVSSWRYGFLHNRSMCTPQIQMLLNLFDSYGITVIGRTKDLQDRYFEIQDYVNTHNVNKYIILDDDVKEYSILDKHLYCVNSTIGLSRKDVNKIIRKY